MHPRPSAPLAVPAAISAACAAAPSLAADGGLGIPPGTILLAHRADTAPIPAEAAKS